MPLNFFKKISSSFLGVATKNTLRRRDHGIRAAGPQEKDASLTLNYGYFRRSGVFYLLSPSCVNCACCVSKHCFTTLHPVVGRLRWWRKRCSMCTILFHGFPVSIIIWKRYFPIWRNYAESISQFRCYIARNCVGFSRLERLVFYRYFYMFRGYCTTLQYFELRDVHWHSRYQVCTYAYNVPVGNKRYKDID